jgi:hypothetical protein
VPTVDGVRTVVPRCDSEFRVEGKRERLSYEDMARSHVKESVREAFQLSGVVVDEDGDLPFPCRTAMFYASLVQQGRVLRVWSRAVSGITVNKSVLREINEVNAGLMYARVNTAGTGVIVDGCLPVEVLRPRDGEMPCTEVGQPADRLGSIPAAVHGGQVAFPGGCDAQHECVVVDDDSWVDDERRAAGDYPQCGSAAPMPIVFGMPILEDYERLSGQVVFAGCCPPPLAPRFSCPRCGNEWGTWPPPEWSDVPAESPSDEP